MITLEKAKIVGNVQVPDLVLKNKVRIVAQLTEKSADALGVKWLLFDSKGVIRQGAQAIELDHVYAGAVVTHEIAKIGKLELAAVQASRFKVFRVGDGKKKPKKLMLAFTVLHSGSPFELVEHMIKCGKGEGIVTVEAPQQMRLDGEEGTRVEMRVESERPVKREYLGKRGWSANITVAAVADGFEVTRRANSPTKKMSQGVPGRYSSEQEALEWGALEVKRWAEKIVAGGTRPEKREAAKLVEWAASMIQREIVNPVQAAREYPD